MAQKNRPGASKQRASSSPGRGSDAARAKSAARLEQMRKQERNRKYGLVSLWVTLAVVAIVVITLVVVQQKGHKNDTKNVSTGASQSLLSNLATVPPSAFLAAGTAGIGKTVAGLEAISGSPDLTNGKPTLIYVGGEFCPYCAAQRWVLATTLNRFGSFTGLETTRSAADDGNFATLTFLHAKYTSKYVAFDGKEVADRAGKKLQVLSAKANASYQKFGQSNSIPFFSVNNAYKGSYQFSPQELGSLTAAEIAQEVHDGKTKLAKDILVASNVLTAAICTQTANKPANVCTAPEVVAAGKAGLTAAGAKTGSTTAP